MKTNKISGLTALPLLFASSAQAVERSNVVFMMTDQQSYYMISAITNSLDPSAPYAKNNFFKTPNLDRLVKSGYTFSNCYAAHPVSGPSRFALLTGDSPNSYGITGNMSPQGENGERIMSLITTRAMGTLFKNAGYQTYYGGKVHLPWANGERQINDKPVKYGFDHYITEDDRAILSQKGAEFISTYDSKDPFLLFLSFMNPHDICMTQMLFNNRQLEEFEDLRDKPFTEASLGWRARINQIEWRKVYNTMDKTRFEGGEFAAFPANRDRTDRFPLRSSREVLRMDDYNLRVHLWFYYRLVEQVDAEIGRVLDALENSPYKDNTIIVFTSDHGEMAGSHGMTGKNVPYEECQKVPLIFAGKGLKKGTIDNTTPVCNGWDMLPTLLDMAGLEIPKELHGLSLYRNMTTGEPINRKILYYETVNSFGVLENGKYKYTRFVREGLGDEDEALFDLEKDPGELHNLVFDPAFKIKLRELRFALADEMELRGMKRLPCKEFTEFEKKVQIEGNDTLRYRILMPEKMDAGKKYPLFIFFHGRGERGNDNEKQLKHCAYRFLDEDVRKKYPSFVIFPQMPPEPSSSGVPNETYAANETARLFWVNNPQTKMAMELIRSMVLNGQADPDRIYIGGLSMGGIITYAMLSTYPDWFAAAVPVCGRTSIQSVASWAKKVPAWLFVGDQDAPFIDYNREMNRFLTEKKAGHKYTEYPGVGHNSWDPAFIEPELFPWIYSNVKKNNIKSFKKK